MKKRTGHLFKRNGIFWLRYSVDGKRFAQTLKTTDKREARAEAARIMAPLATADTVETIQAMQTRLESASSTADRLADEANPPAPLIKVWSMYLSSESRPQSGPLTLREYESHWDALHNWLKDHHPEARLLRDVTAKNAEGFIKHLAIEKQLSGNRINKHSSFLKTLFRVLGKDAKVKDNPFEGIQRRNQLPHSKRPLTIEEIRAAIERAEGELQTMLMLGTFTGLRMADCATLLWGEVDMARSIIRRVPRKTARKGKVVIIGLPEVLATHLARLPRKGPYVMPDTAALYARDQRALVLKVQRHLESCGIRTTQPGTGFEVKDGKEIHSGKRAVVDVGFHSLRHSFVSLHAQAGTSQPILQQLVGHGSPIMTEIYTHLDADSARSTAASFPLALTGATTLTKREPLPAWTADRLNSMTAKNWKAIRDEILA